jgi:DNA primase large subunit
VFCRYERAQACVLSGSWVKNIPLTQSDLARFPFLSKQYISRLDLDVAELSTLISIIDRAKQRITASFAGRFDRPSKISDIEIFSFPVAILIVTGTKDSTLKKRYALFEAKKMSESLQEERDEIILEVAKFFGWDIHYFQKHQPCPYTISFVNYLNNATRGRLVYQSRWKLVNRRIHRGDVDVGKNEVCRLLQEEIRILLEEKTEQEMPQVPQSTQDAIDEIKSKYLAIKPYITQIEKLRVVAEESEYPPCIQNLYDRMAKGQHLSHIERFTLVTYLLHQGISVDAIVNLFASLSDYRQSQTRYQVEHLAGKTGSRTVYRPPNCATLQTHGVCVNLEDPICRTIRSPLTYHLRKKSMRKKI